MNAAILEIKKVRYGYPCLKLGSKTDCVFSFYSPMEFFLSHGLIVAAHEAGANPLILDAMEGVSFEGFQLIE